jgi:hypothetical protein
MADPIGAREIIERHVLPIVRESQLTELILPTRKPIYLRFTQPIKIAHSIPHLWDFESCRHNSIKWINGS